VIYISDHGESLGENGLFLHGTPYKLAPEQQTKVPLMMWFSDSFKQNNRIDEKCLQQNAKTVAYSHDNLFHSLLGLMNVSTSLYQPNLVILDLMLPGMSSIDICQQARKFIKDLSWY